MTEAEIRMRRILIHTGLYTGEDKIFSAEMAAYGAGLEILSEALEKLRNGLFVQTAGADGLERFEKLFRIRPSSDNPEIRRAMLLERGAVTPADHTKAALEKQLLAAGIRGTIVENDQDGLNVNVQEVLGISETAAESEARAFMPAHLPCVFDFGSVTWDAADDAALTFDEMDAKDYTWDQIDSL
ncbi:MAG: hypothetical protein ACI4GO_05520 [Hominenteromicrobium sp.]